MKNNLLMWFGASETIFPYANQYITIYLLGTIFALMAVGMNQFIICQGFAKVGMKSVTLGAIINIILDPVFIFVLEMGSGLRWQRSCPRWRPVPLYSCFCSAKRSRFELALAVMSGELSER